MLVAYSSILSRIAPANLFLFAHIWLLVAENALTDGQLVAGGVKTFHRKFTQFWVKMKFLIYFQK